MPSDPRSTQALDALAEPIESFRSMLSNTSEQIRLLISTRVETNGSSVGVARAELGEFAAGRIDPERMAKLLMHVEPAALAHGDVVRRALEVCNQLLARREDLFRVVVEAGDDLRNAVGRALADIGKAFAVTRIVELVAQDHYREEDHAGLLEGHPYEEWSRAERAVELALVVCVAGSDLRVGGLADYLDRSFKLVLVVDGEAPPAALVRLITPGTLVMQTADAQELEWIARHDGSAVVALVPETAARFRHDPTGGPTLADRIVITHLPEKSPQRLGHSSAYQQQQDLDQLEALAFAPQPPDETVATAPLAEKHDEPVPVTATAVAEPVVPIAAAAPASDAVDRLSAWLLDHTDLTSPNSN